MCFSTEASIGAGAVLCVIGVLAVKKAKEPHQYLFAGIPLLFSVQQWIEGIVWMSFTHEAWESYRSMATIGFLLIGQVIWAVFLPASIMLFEEDKRKKLIFKMMLAAGILVAAYFLYCMIFFNVDVSIVNHHVFYKLDYPKAMIPVAAGFYLVATVGPAVASKNIKIRLMGFFILVSYIITRLFFQPSLISVWCFIAAAIGVLVYLALSEMNKKKVIPLIVPG
jgi:hypothetical protein